MYPKYSEKGICKTGAMGRPLLTANASSCKWQRHNLRPNRRDNSRICHGPEPALVVDASAPVNTTGVPGRASWRRRNSDEGKLARGRLSTVPATPLARSSQIQRSNFARAPSAADSRTSPSQSRGCGRGAPPMSNAVCLHERANEVNAGSPEASGHCSWRRVTAKVRHSSSPSDAMLSHRLAPRIAAQPAQLKKSMHRGKTKACSPRKRSKIEPRAAPSTPSQGPLASMSEAITFRNSRPMPSPSAAGRLSTCHTRSSRNASTRRASPPSRAAAIAWACLSKSTLGWWPVQTAGKRSSMGTTTPKSASTPKRPPASVNDGLGDDRAVRSSSRLAPRSDTA
mmetsp:Transcript_24316/g.69049  ORF Transcript_24316/g.69049 Transcript_24316/m.69049 type:complete len:340 (+) Transcript_24316:767-1786(+)